MKDNNLIDELREGMRARTDHTEVPNGFADRARRTARRRSARRAAAAGTPLLAAAGVATILATSAGSGGSFPRAAQAPNVAVSGGQAHDTAYIVTRVKAKVAADSHNGTLIHTYAYGSGDVRSDGSIVNLKYEVSNGYEYTAPDGAVYWRTTLYDDAAGTARFDEIDDWIPDANGKYTSTRILINLAKQTYSQNVYDGESGPSTGPTPNLQSSPSEVQQALQNGHVTNDGTTTINGTHAIALSVTLPNRPGVAPSERFTLYADTQTYQPLRTLYAYDGHLNLEVNDWVPATPANITIAKDDSIPAGYTKVAKAH
jgi:hypothetical protein